MGAAGVAAGSLLQGVEVARFLSCFTLSPADPSVVSREAPPPLLGRPQRLSEGEENYLMAEVLWS